jgi:NDP-sugar pyrophosphorylase family protein
MHPVAILAGGLASRMHPSTRTVPKALLEIAGRPFIDHQLTRLSQQGVEDVVLCVGHLGEQVEAFVADGRRWSVRVHYSRDGDVLLGTGGALRRALPLLPDVFFVMYGDSYLTCDFAAVSGAFRASGRSGLMTLFRNNNRFGASNVCFEHGRIRRYDKHAASADMKHIDYGLSILTAGTVAAYPPDIVFDLSRVFQDLIATGRLAGFEVPDRFYEIGSPEGFRETEAYLTHGGQRP